MESRRLVLVLDRWDPGRGGLEAYARSFAEASVEAGIETTLLVGEARGPVPERVALRALGARGLAFYRAADLELRRMGSARILAFRHPGDGADVFAALGGLFRGALEAKRASEAVPVRLLRRVARGLSRSARTLLERERAFFSGEGPRILLAPSPRVGDEARRFFPSFRGKVLVTGLPIDRTRFTIPSAEEREEARAAFGVPEDAKVLCFVGNDARRKGLRLAVEVCRRLRARRIDARLFVRGQARPLPSPGRRALLREGALRVLGPGDPLPLYRAADLCLHPSLEDSFALVVAEALSCGLPVVTTAAVGAAAWIPDAGCGRVVADPTDLSALDRAALLSLAEDELAPPRRRKRREAVADCEPELHFRRIFEALGLVHDEASSPAPHPET